MQNQNYGLFFTIPMVLGLVAVGAVALPVLIFGIGTVVRFFQFMWSPVVSGSIPVWSIFVAGMVVLLFLRMRRKR